MCNVVGLTHIAQPFQQSVSVVAKKVRWILPVLRHVFRVYDLTCSPLEDAIVAVMVLVVVMVSAVVMVIVMVWYGKV